MDQRKVMAYAKVVAIIAACFVVGYLLGRLTMALL
jgi:hypothetical protein